MPLFGRKKRLQLQQQQQQPQPQQQHHNNNSPEAENAANPSAANRRKPFAAPSELVAVKSGDPTVTNIVGALNARDFKVFETDLRQNPKAAEDVFIYRKSEETLLSVVLCVQAPKSTVQAVYESNSSAITRQSRNGLTPLHQASTVPTTCEVMSYLIDRLERHNSVKLARTPAPGGWTVLHTAIRYGALPVDTFLLLIKKSRSALDKVTDNTLSTPLHLAFYGLEKRPPAEQRPIYQKLIQEFPYAVNASNKEGNTPVTIAQRQAAKGRLSKDIVAFLLDVQGLVMRKYNTRFHIERAIEQCQTRLNNMRTTANLDMAKVADNIASLDISMDASVTSVSTHGSSEEGNSRNRNNQFRSSTDRKSALWQAMLADMEMKMLLPLRKRFLSEDELRAIIETKTRERTRLSQMGPQVLPQTMALNEELIELEKRLKREIDAVVPENIQATSRELYRRLQSGTHLLPINNVSLEFLIKCTDNFAERNRIGKGGFGAVYLARDPATGAEYACKKTDKLGGEDASLLQEVKVLARVFHPNIINLLGFYVPPQGRAPEFLVYEYAAGGTIADRVSSKENRQSLTWQIRLSAAVGVASGLNFLHNGTEHKIYHHDVKPENIVFSESLDRAILIDCGIAKVLKANQTVHFKKTLAGTPFYLPDDYTEDTPYDEKCEVFSFGMVLRVLLSGKMPRSLRDRSTELVPDPLAGSWPSAVLTRLMELTQNCVSSNADERPTVEQLYLDLMQLEAEAEKKVELTKQQQETINITLTNSRAVSRPSRTLEAFGQCSCSRHKKKGLYCPAKLHFICTECFNKHALEYLGEEIYCRETCSCFEPFTLDELHRHVKRSTLCRHVELLMKNQELKAYKEANAQMMGEIGKGFDRVMRGVTNLARDDLRCPLLALLIPVRSDPKKSLMKRALETWKSTTKKSFFLFFLCAHDHSLVMAPITVEATREWVRRAIPFLRAVLAGLQVAVLASGVPINIPMIPGERRDDNDDIAENLQVLDQMLLGATDSKEKADQEMKIALQALQNTKQGERMSSDSYRMVADLANKPGNMAWKDRMVLVERMGELAWVSKENEAKWRNGLGQF